MYKVFSEHYKCFIKEKIAEIKKNHTGHVLWGKNIFLKT